MISAEKKNGTEQEIFSNIEHDRVMNGVISWQDINELKRQYMIVFQMKDFMKIDFFSERVPDSTTILHFK